VSIIAAISEEYAITGLAGGAPPPAVVFLDEPQYDNVPTIKMLATIIKGFLTFVILLKHSGKMGFAKIERENFSVPAVYVRFAGAIAYVTAMKL